MPNRSKRVCPACHLLRRFFSTALHRNRVYPARPMSVQTFLAPPVCGRPNGRFPLDIANGMTYYRSSSGPRAERLPMSENGRGKRSRRQRRQESGCAWRYGTRQTDTTGGWGFHGRNLDVEGPFCSPPAQHVDTEIMTGTIGTKPRAPGPIGGLGVWPGSSLTTRRHP